MNSDVAVDQAARACLVTGAAGGIGRALVRGFHGVGYRVLATDLGDAPGGLPHAAWIRADLVRFAEDPDYAAAIVEQILAALAGTPLHVLVNNAAVQILGGADNLTRADWRSTLDVNLLAPFLLSQALLAPLEQASGCIVNIGSIHARLTKQNFVAYATSKAALAGMTRALAVDLGPRVRVNCIEPAAIATEMLKAGFDGKPDLYDQLAQYHPQQRIGQVEEVARLALAIADEGVSFLQGACISFDGAIGCRLFDLG